MLGFGFGAEVSRSRRGPAGLWGAWFGWVGGVGVEGFSGIFVELISHFKVRESAAG